MKKQQEKTTEFYVYKCIDRYINVCIIEGVGVVSLCMLVNSVNSIVKPKMI